MIIQKSVGQEKLIHFKLMIWRYMMRAVVHSVQKFVKEEFTLVFAVVVLLALIIGASGAR